MKHLLSVLSLATLVAATSVHAHEAHGKPQHGGVFGEAADYQTELVASPDKLTLYITEHGAPLPTAGGSAKLTLLAGGEKREIPLPPAGDNRFEATGTFKVKGAKVVATVNVPGKPAKTLRYTLD